MKKIKLTSLILAGSIIVLLAILSFKPAANENSYLIVRTIETQYAGFSKILISDGSSIIKTIELQRMFVKSAKVTENFLTIAKALEEVRTQGYILITSNSSGGYDYMVANYVFEKK